MPLSSDFPQWPWQLSHVSDPCETLISEATAAAAAATAIAKTHRQLCLAPRSQNPWTDFRSWSKHLGKVQGAVSEALSSVPEPSWVLPSLWQCAGQTKALPSCSKGSGCQAPFSLLCRVAVSKPLLTGQTPSLLGLVNAFYWNAATPIVFILSVPVLTHRGRAELPESEETAWPQSLNYLPFGILIEKV